MRTRRLLFVFVALAAGCAAGSAPPLPGAPVRESASSRFAQAQAKPTPKPTPTKTPKPVLNAKQIAAALDSAESYYAKLPHSDLTSDLQSVAKYMVSSKTFAAAAVSTGGISATFVDGSPGFIFADHPELYETTSATPADRVPNGSFPVRAFSGPTQHEIAFLVNELDASGAFVPARQYAFGEAFDKLGFPQAGYGVDVLDVTLDNIVALGQNHPLDFLDLATHGAVAAYAGPRGPTLTYLNISSTPITDAARAQYKNDLAGGNLWYGSVLSSNIPKIDTPVFAFTPQFLTEHLRFNPGAIVDNQSCFGGSPWISAALGATLKAAGVGRYFGWTKPVIGAEADESDAFLLDRLLGEQQPSVTGLNRLATQRVPAQRPFPLDAIESVMQTETRSGILGCNKTFPYTVSDCPKYDKPGSGTLTDPPVSDGYKSRLLVFDFGGEKVPAPPIEYALPSIDYMSVGDSFTSTSTKNNLLTIYGTFPLARGTVEVTNAAGTAKAPVTKWRPCIPRETVCLAAGNALIQATLPDRGAGSYGLVTVRSAPEAGGTTGIGSNAPALTQWSGTFGETDSESITSLNGLAGSGSGHAAASYAFTIRADVHPTVGTIDTTPAPQNFSFTDVAPGSTGTLASAGGNFASGKVTAAFKLGPGTTLTTGTPCAGGYCGFQLKPFAWPGGSGKPACGASITPGPQSGASNSLCVQLLSGFAQGLACSDNQQGGFCFKPTGEWNGEVLHVETQPPLPSIVLTLDPATEKISASVKSPPPKQTNAYGFYAVGNYPGVSDNSLATFTYAPMTLGPPQPAP